MCMWHYFSRMGAGEFMTPVNAAMSSTGNKLFHPYKVGGWVDYPSLSFSDFIWPFLRPYMGVIPNPKMAFIFPIRCILALIVQILINYFLKCEGKGSFLKPQIRSLSLETFTSTSSKNNNNYSHIH